MQNREFYRRHLPHWYPQHATFFITTRLANSLPKHIIQELLHKRTKAIQVNSVNTPKNELKEIHYQEELKHFGRWDKLLDQCNSGPDWLKIPAIAAIIKDAIHYRDGKIYDLIAFCIMSNHIHLVFHPLPDSTQKPYDISKIMHSLKRYTARQANLVLNRKGEFWHHESYDHVVRDEKELQRIVEYVLFNPVKAGLVSNWDEWEWSYINGDWFK